MTVLHFYDDDLDLPLFRVLGESESLLNRVEEINLTIQNLASQWPWTRNLYGGPEPYEQVCAATCFLASCRRRTTFSRCWTTADLKLDVERAMGLFVSEGYYLAAAKRLGLKLEPTSNRDSFHINLRLDKKYRDFVPTEYAARTSALGTPIGDSQLVGV